jgi:hypothetical protein
MFYVYWLDEFGFIYRETVSALDVLHAAIIIVRSGRNRSPFGVDRIGGRPCSA